ncbi:Hypothetical predicted protein [Cloeon dipterum]|nr:Hypothetical predicted protein [Cloeon dipterum]
MDKQDSAIFKYRNLISNAQNDLKSEIKQLKSLIVADDKNSKDEVQDLKNECQNSMKVAIFFFFVLDSNFWLAASNIGQKGLEFKWLENGVVLPNESSLWHDGVFNKYGETDDEVCVVIYVDKLRYDRCGNYHNFICEYYNVL